MIYIGVDPGKKGGYAVIGDDGSYKAYPWDDAQFLMHMSGLTMMRDLEGHKLVAAVEKVGAFSGQGVKSMFSFGHSLGYIEGVLAAFGIPYQLIPPATWKRSFSLIGKDKKASIEVCHKLFPDMNLLPTDRSRVPSDGMAEAALICLYAKRNL